PGWRPVVGDWNNDGRSDIGVVDLSTETWFLRSSASGGLPDFGVFQYGLPGWQPVVGHWDGPNASRPRSAAATPSRMPVSSVAATNGDNLAAPDLLGG